MEAELRVSCILNDALGAAGNLEIEKWIRDTTAFERTKGLMGKRGHGRDNFGVLWVTVVTS